MNEDTPLLGPTLRKTAVMLVPVVAFLAILSAVALFAVPQTPSGDPVAPSAVAADKDKADKQAPDQAPRNTGGARASVRPNKI